MSNQSLDSQWMELDGYYDKPFRKDRNCFGGGVLVYVSTTLKVTRRVDLEYDNHEFIHQRKGLDFQQYRYLPELKSTGSL
jgi:hypothetical protein